MAKRTTPSNSAVAKKLEAIKKAAANKKAATVASKAEAVKKSAAKKASATVATKAESTRKSAARKVAKPTSEPKKAPVKKAPRKPTAKKVAPKKSEPTKVDIDFESYPKTSIVLAWQEMVQGALDRYEATLTDSPTVDQKKRADLLKERIRRAPYDLRHTGRVNKYSSRSIIDPLSNKPEPVKKKRAARKKSVRKKK